MIGDITKRKERQTRFKRVFIPRMKSIGKTITLIGNCSNRNNYEWHEETTKRSFLLIAQILLAQAEKFGLSMELTYDGQSVQSMNPTDPDLFKLEEQS